MSHVGCSPRHSIWIGGPPPPGGIAAQGYRTRTPAQVPEHLDPAMRFVLRSILERDPGDRARVWWRVEAEAGVGQDGLRMWLYRKPGGRGPSIDIVRRALRVLHTDLVMVPLE